MIYLTSDIHGMENIDRISPENFPDRLPMTKKDFLIVCGDLCVFWNDSEKERELRDRFEKFPFTTLFVDGNHENFDLLNATPVSQWNGGNVHLMGKSLIHLMRGQMFHLEGSLFFTMGGGYSGDHYRRLEHKNWWRDEIPTREELTCGLETLKRFNWKADYVLTHGTSMRMIRKAGLNEKETILNVYFDYLENRMEFCHWYFGHFHKNQEIDERHTLIYDRIIRLT